MGQPDCKWVAFQQAIETAQESRLPLRYFHPPDDVIQVTDDKEVQAWWEEVKTKGHPDSDPSEWPELTDVESLADVAASIMWTSSCHHAGGILKLIRLTEAVQ